MKGSGNIENNEKYLDEILQNNNLQMELATQIFSNDQTVRSNTVQDIKDFLSQSLAIQAKKGEQLVSMMPAVKKAFDIMGDDIVELIIENDTLKNLRGSYDKKW